MYWNIFWSLNEQVLLLLVKQDRHKNNQTALSRVHTSAEDCHVLLLAVSRNRIS